MHICLILIDSFYLILECILVFSFKYVLKPFYHVLQMARTKKTARKSIGGRAFARRTVPAPVEPAPALVPAPVLAQPEEVEEVPRRDYFFDEDQEGNIREVDADGNMQPSLPSPTPAHDLGPPLAYFEAQVPATAVAGGGEEEEPLEMSEDEAPAPPPAPPAPAAPTPAPAGGDPEGPEDPDDEDDDEDDQNDDPQKKGDCTASTPQPTRRVTSPYCFGIRWKSFTTPWLPCTRQGTMKTLRSATTSSLGST